MNALCLGLMVNHQDDQDYAPRKSCGLDMSAHLNDRDSDRFEIQPESDTPLFDQSIL